MSNAKITLVIEGVHMGLGHIGLTALLKKKGFDVKDLHPGSLILCLNTRGDKLKVLGSFGLVLGYLRLNRGERIYKEALQFIPQCFGATGLDYTAACRKAIEKRLQPQITGPLQKARALQKLKELS